MKLSQKSKDLLELIFMTGLDAMANCSRLHHSISIWGEWENHTSYLRQMKAIEAKGLLEVPETRSADWLPQLTQSGFEMVAEQVDPCRHWDQRWDGLWRSLTFDLPSSQRKERQRLNTWLKNSRFGHLQGSLWISVRPYRDWALELASMDIDPKAAIFLEGRPLGLLTDARIAERAWKFEELAVRYEAHRAFLREHPPSQGLGDVATSFAEWFKKESALWGAALAIDPLLPRELWPRAYAGFASWEARREAFAEWKLLLTA